MDGVEDGTAVHRPGPLRNRGHSKEARIMRNLLTRITLGATFATALTFGACFEQICAGDLTGRPILERICSFEPPQV